MVVDFIVFFKELLVESQSSIGKYVLCSGTSVYAKADGSILPSGISVNCILCIFLVHMKFP